MTVPDEERRPIPLDAVRREYREFLRGQGIDPDTVDFKVEHARYIGKFGRGDEGDHDDHPQAS